MISRRRMFMGVAGALAASALPLKAISQPVVGRSLLVEARLCLLAAIERVANPVYAVLAGDIGELTQIDWQRTSHLSALDQANAHWMYSLYRQTMADHGLGEVFEPIDQLYGEVVLRVQDDIVIRPGAVGRVGWTEIEPGLWRRIARDG